MEPFDKQTRFYLKDDQEEVLLLALGRLHFLLQPLDLLLQLTLLILAGFVHVLIVPAVPLENIIDTQNGFNDHTWPGSVDIKPKVTLLCCCFSSLSLASSNSCWIFWTCLSIFRMVECRISQM